GRLRDEVRKREREMPARVVIDETVAVGLADHRDDRCEIEHSPLDRGGEFRYVARIGEAEAMDIRAHVQNYSGPCWQIHLFTHIEFDRKGRSATRGRDWHLAVNTLRGESCLPIVPPDCRTHSSAWRGPIWPRSRRSRSGLRRRPSWPCW